MRQESTMVIANWRPVTRTVRDWTHDTRRFKRIATTHASLRGGAGVRSGRALWGLWTRDCPMGIYWEWAELRPGVVTLSNPLNVHSNVALLSDCGDPLDGPRMLLELNNAVHAMNWQREVCDELLRADAVALAGQPAFRPSSRPPIGACSAAPLPVS